jgi:hypothetical protein
MPIQYLAFDIIIGPGTGDAGDAAAGGAGSGRVLAVLARLALALDGSV